MSHLRLNPEIRKQLESEVGPLPEVGSPAFEALRKELKETRPHLAQLLTQGFDVPGVELPDETQARKAERREQRRSVMRYLFFSPTHEGDSAVNKRKVMAVTASLLFLTLPVAFIAQEFGRAGTSEAKVEPEDVQMLALTPLAPTELELQEEAPEPHPFEPVQAYQRSAEPKAYEAPPTVTSHAQPLPPAPGPVDPAVANAPPGQAQTTSPGLSVYTRSPQEEPLSAFSGQLQQIPSLSVYAASPPAGQMSVAIPQQQAIQTLSVTPPATSAGTSLSVFTVNDAETSSLSVVSEAPRRSRTQPQGDDSEPFRISVTAPAEEPEADSPLTAFQASAAPQPQEQAVPATPAPQQTATQPQEAPFSVLNVLQPGSRIPAHLATGVALVAGATSPVVAETPEGDWCGTASCPGVTWLGNARLEGANRVAISFNQAVIESSTRPVEAVALSTDNLPGLLATVRDETPTVAQDLLRAAAGGVSSYVDALARRQQLIIRDGHTIVTDLEPPPLSAMIGSRMAGLFNLPADQTTLVRVAEIQPGAPLHILYGVSSGR